MVPAGAGLVAILLAAAPTVPAAPAADASVSAECGSHPLAVLSAGLAQDLAFRIGLVDQKGVLFLDDCIRGRLGFNAKVDVKLTKLPLEGELKLLGCKESTKQIEPSWAAAIAKLLEAKIDLKQYDKQVQADWATWSGCYRNVLSCGKKVCAKPKVAPAKTKPPEPAPAVQKAAPHEGCVPCAPCQPYAPDASVPSPTATPRPMTPLAPVWFVGPELTLVSSTWSPDDESGVLKVTFKNESKSEARIAVYYPPYDLAQLGAQTEYTQPGETRTTTLALDRYRGTALKFGMWSPGFLDVQGSGGGAALFTMPATGSVHVSLSRR